MTIEMIMQSSALFPDLDTTSVNGNHPQEDERSLQIALELSNLGLLGINEDEAASYDDIAKGKKSQNMTECVPVPSSEHVAEIVGRQGCKIKALRAKTNTYIKTPVRGEDPVFVVTGRKEDVAMARREVQSAAEHFTQIRASRNRHALLASQALGAVNGDGNSGTITLQVRVPYRVVGLVVGPKGATIKRIQQQTHTYIVTPSRDKEPVFEVTGLPENVEKAKEEIEAHIASRTGSQQTSIDDDFRNNGTEVGSPLITADLAKINSQTTKSTFIPSSIQNSVLRPAASSFFPETNQTYPAIQTSRGSLLASPPAELLGLRDRPYQTNAMTGRVINTCYPEPLKVNMPWSVGANNNQYEMPTSSASHTMPSFLPNVHSNGLNANVSQTQHRLSPTLSDVDFPSILVPPSTQSFHLPVRRVGSDESTTSSVPSMDVGNLLTPTSSYASPATPAVNIESGYSSSGTADSVTSGSPDSALGPRHFFKDNFTPKPQRCIVCNENSVSTALIPCGHLMFCSTCASDVVSQSAAHCPWCDDTATKALLIKQ